MSLFSWFSRKPAPPKPRPMAEPSGLLNADATVPLSPGRQGKPLLEPVPPEHAANRKLASMLDRLGFRVEVGTHCEHGIAVAARRRDAAPAALAA